MDRTPVKEILQIWEQGERKTSLDNSLELLRISSFATTKDDPATLSIGERDIRLLRLRTQMFGSHFTNVAHCPACKEQVEWTTSVADLIASHKAQKTELIDAYIQSYHIQFRLPNSSDLLDIAVTHNEEAATKAFLLQCIQGVENENQTCDPAELPDDVLDQLDKHISEEDPLAVIRMSLTCPGCAHKWPLTFDIISYLWIEIDHWARHTLREVAQIAYAFGWSESEILSMSSRRTKIDLKMIGV